MNLIAVLVPVILLYAALLYWLSLRFKLIDFWREGDSAMPNVHGKKLTRLVKIGLDILLAFFVALLVVWPPMVVLLAITQNSIPTWGIDISIFSGFRLDLNALPGIEFGGLRNPEISGKTMLAIDTSNVKAWYLFAGVSELAAIALVYCLIQLRAFIISLNNGISFIAENTTRIKNVGVVILCCNLLNPVLQYFVWGEIVNDISIQSSGIQLYPAFGVNFMGIFSGLLMIVLSEILQEATELSREQELTI